MKIFVTSIVFVTIVVSSSAQNSLSTTTWKGVMLIPGATDVRLNFKKDSLCLTTESGKRLAP